MEVNKHGHAYKAISDEHRSLIIDETVENGGDTTTGFIPVSLDCIAKKFRLKIDTVKEVRKRFYTTGEFKRPKTVSRGVKHLQPEDPELEIMRNTQSSNITVNQLPGANGVMYVNTVNRVSDTLNFLQFFDEASRCFQPDGRPVLEYGDHIIVVNCATHRFLGGWVLGEWLDDISCVLVYLPSYSPELNPAEIVFNKLKTCLKNIEYRERLRYNLRVGVYEGLKQITAAYLRGFYGYTGYIHF